MKRVLTAIVLIPLVLVLVFLGPRWLIIVATAVLAGLAAWEYLGLAERGAARPPRIAVVVAIIVLFIGNSEYPDLTAAVFGALPGAAALLHFRLTSR